LEASDCRSAPSKHPSRWFPTNPINALEASYTERLLSGATGLVSNKSN